MCKKKFGTGESSLITIICMKRLSMMTLSMDGNILSSCFTLIAIFNLLAIYPLKIDTNCFETWKFLVCKLRS